jgi:hypothetical protein
MQTDIHSHEKAPVWTIPFVWLQYIFLFAGLNIHHHVWAAVYLPGKPPRWQGNRLPGRGPVRQVKHWRVRLFFYCLENYLDGRAVVCQGRN